MKIKGTKTDVFRSLQILINIEDRHGHNVSLFDLDI